MSSNFGNVGETIETSLSKMGFPPNIAGLSVIFIPHKLNII